MRKIEKKVWPKYFEAILNGDKNFEIRLADWKCKKGDTLILKEWDPKSSKYTGRIVSKKVSYVAYTKNTEKFFSSKDIKRYGYQVIALKDL